MTRPSARIFVLAIVALGAVAFAAWLYLGRPRPETPARQEPDGPTSLAPSADATLYFPGPGARLGTEVRELAAAQSAEERTRRVVEALLAGPETPGLVAPLPSGIAVGSVLVALDGTAFLDLVTADGPADLAWGSKQELLTVYSLVNSVVANEPRARRVMLLWNGQQRLTFAGHVDVTRPLTLHEGLVARSARARPAATD